MGIVLKKINSKQRAKKGISQQGDKEIGKQRTQGRSHRQVIFSTNELKLQGGKMGDFGR
jgi:hypothetical protein